MAATGLQGDDFNRTILLVEDNEINIRVATLYLNEFGYTNVVIARTGEEALTLFSDKIALVILDIGLPDMSGIAICQKLRERVDKKLCPIIAYTAIGDQNAKELTAAGFDDCLIKPVMMEEFKSMIQRYLNYQ
jgi:CheY-like chemotaxis protein